MWLILLLLFSRHGAGAFISSLDRRKFCGNGRLYRFHSNLRNAFVFCHFAFATIGPFLWCEHPAATACHIDRGKSIDWGHQDGNTRSSDHHLVCPHGHIGCWIRMGTVTYPTVISNKKKRKLRKPGKPGLFVKIFLQNARYILQNRKL